MAETMPGDGPVDLGSPGLHAHRDGRVLHVRIDNPERRNAMRQDMYRGVKRAAILADRDPDLDVLCLTGTGDVFAVGGDMSGSGTPDDTLATEWDPTDHFPFRHLERCRATVLCAVNGLCYAGGLNLVLYSDLAIASDQARFRAPELIRGMPDAWMSARLAGHVGTGRAKYLLFTATVIDAHEAERIGLVGRVVPDDVWDAAVAETVAAVLACGPTARSLVKTDMNAALRPPDATMFARTIGGPEMLEGMRAFMERREPDWPRPDR